MRKLDLRVVRRDDLRARGGHERLADAPALRRAHGDVLQVRVVGGETPRHGDGLRVVRVHAAGLGVHHARQLVGVGALELGERPVLEERLRQRVVERQLLEHLLVRGGRARGRLLHHRELQLREEDLAQLLRAREVEGLARELVRLRLQCQHLLAQLLALPREEVRVDEHAVSLHHEEHAEHRHLDLGVHVSELRVGLDPGPERVVKLERDVGVLGRVLRGGLDAHLVEGNRGGALARHLVVGDGLRAEVAKRQRVHVVALVALQHVGGEQRVVGDAAHRDAVVGEHVAVVLRVLAQLRALRVLEPGLEPRERALAVELVGRAGIAVRERHVARLARLDAEGKAHELGRHRVEARGLGVEAGEPGGGDPRDPALEGGLVEDRLVAAVGDVSPRRARANSPPLRRGPARARAAKRVRAAAIASPDAPSPSLSSAARSERKPKRS